MPDRHLAIEPGTPTTFTHDRALFFFRVWGEGILSLVVAVYSLYKLVAQQGDNPLWLIPLGVAGYTFYRLLLRGGAPRRITVNADAIEFDGPGGHRIHRYADMEMFHVRQFSASKTLYVRIRNAAARGQKCWIEWTVYSDSDVLLSRLLEVERMVHPDSLKEQVRQNQERFERTRRRSTK